jgi:glycolate oxidase FAD binding subunit
MGEVLRPASEAELAEMVRGANAPLRVRGGATRHVPEPGQGVTTRGLSGITLYEPGALTMVAGAGTPMAEIEAALAAENQRLAFEPMDHRAITGAAGEPTLGGAVSVNASGPRRVAAGACRDSLLGLRFVDGEGQVVKNGGRVMKNVTGYDLVKLLCGARGTLGIVTEVALKVLPGVETEATLVLEGLTPEAAVAAMAAGLGSPYEVTGAAHDAGAGRTLLRIEGLAGSVAYRAERLGAVLAAHGEVARLEAEASRAAWLAVRDARAVAGGAGDVWRVSTRPSRAAALLERADAEAALMDWGGGLIWLRMAEGADLRARLGAFAGHATRLRGRGPGAVPAEAAEIAALSDGLRARFDPRGILNPGLLAPA